MRAIATTYLQWEWLSCSLFPPNAIYLSFSSSQPNRAHAAELGNVVPDEPMLFLKPTSSYVVEGGAIEVGTSFKYVSMGQNSASVTTG